MQAAVTRRYLVCAATGRFAAALIGSGRAQSSYPERSIKVIVPYTAGSPNDTFARAVAPVLALRVKQPVIVDDRPGGGTLVGLKAVTTSAPDGYTLLFTNTPTHVIAEFCC
jgi:tripartite-type tricarboxylate transporter receptor subunit TctC